MNNAIKAIQGATADLKEDNAIHARNEIYMADKLIKDASPELCLHLIRNLIERVSEITGMAVQLEDAACALQAHIDSEKDIEK